MLKVLDPVDSRMDISWLNRLSRRKDKIAVFGLCTFRFVVFDNDIIMRAAAALSMVELDASSIIRRLEAFEITGE